MGQSVQQLLSRSPHYDLAVPRSEFADLDARDYFADFLALFPTKPNLLKLMSSPHAVCPSFF
jgi:hypothetical protein